MNLKYKILLILETIVFFSIPVIALWGMTFYSRVTFSKVFSWEFVSSGGIGWSIIVVGGLLGLCSILSMLVKIIAPNSKFVLPRKTLIIFIVLGITPILLSAIAINNSRFYLTMVLFPFLGSIHLVYLSRHYLGLSAASKSLKSGTPKSGAPKLNQ